PRLASARDPPGHPRRRPPDRPRHVPHRRGALLAGGDRSDGRPRALPSRGRRRDGAGRRQGRHPAVPERGHRLVGGGGGGGVSRAQGVPALYHGGDRAWSAALLARVEASGYLCVCLTVDVQVYSRRERDIAARFTPREAMLKAPNPRPPDPDYPARLTWADVDWLRKTTRLPIGLKGIMTAR